MDSSSDHTAVTGAPTPVVVRRGDVIGERYEIRGRLRDDPFSHGFLALDQESEDPVLLRVVRAELLETADRNGVVRALRRFVGVGGRFLPGLLDADRDGPFVYATESVPSGVTLRDVLDGRLREGSPLEPAELLPVIGYLDAALGAIPSSMRHGDVQADLVWIDRDRLELTGAFFVPALPAGAVAAVLQRHGDLRRRYAPELLQGIGGPAADRFGVGAIAHEALTLRPPPPPGESVSSSLGALAEPLAALLHPDLAKRTRSLDGLLETLSRLSGHPPLELDAGSFQVDRRMRPQRPSSAPPPRTPSPSPRTAPSEPRYVASTPRMPSHAAPSAPSHAAPSAPPNAPSHTAPSAPTPPSHAVPMTPSHAVPSVAKLSRERRMSPVPGIDDLHTERLPALDVAAAEALLAKSGEITKLASDPASDPAIVSPPHEPRTTPPVASGASRPASRSSVPPIARPLAPRGRDASDPPSASPPKPAATAAPPKSAVQVVALEPLVAKARDGEGAHHLSFLTAVPKPPSGEEATADAKKSRADDLDPRLVRAALGISLDASTEEHIDEDETNGEGVPLDPGVPAKPRKERTQELRLEDLEASDGDDDADETDHETNSEGVPLDPSVPAKPRKERTQELQLDELEEENGEDVHPPTYGGTQNLSLDELERMAADHRRAAVPQDVKPMPRARRDSTPPVVRLPALYDDGAPAAARPRAPRMTPVPVVAAAAMSATAAGTSPRAERFSPAAPRPSRRTALLWIAIAVGVAIVLGSFAYAAWKQSRAEDERRQRLQERFEQLQRNE